MAMNLFRFESPIQRNYWNICKTTATAISHSPQSEHQREKEVADKLFTLLNEKNCFEKLEKHPHAFENT